MKNYYFNEEHELFRQGLKDFLNKEVVPNIEKWEEEQRIPKEIFKKFGDMGYLGLNYPEKYGGIDEFLVQAKNSQLTDEAKILKKQITQNLQKK